MKATGIVRRIDDLGRIVIPKELRRVMRIDAGDAMEIYTENERIILTKYSPIKELEMYAGELMRAVTKVTNKNAMVCDREEIRAVGNSEIREYIGQKISTDLLDIIGKRTKTILSGNECIDIISGCDNEFSSQAIIPVISEGQVLGAVIIAEENSKIGEENVKAAELAALIIGEQMQ